MACLQATARTAGLPHAKDTLPGAKQQVLGDISSNQAGRLPAESKEEGARGSNVLGYPFEDGMDLFSKLRSMSLAFGDTTMPFLALQDLCRPAFL